MPSNSTAALGGLEIDITIVQGKSLVPKDRNIIGRLTTSDPFVKLCFGGKRYGKTTHKPKTLNPVWNERFKVMVGRDELGRKPSLEFQIFDKDTLSPDDPMGVVMITLDELMGTPSGTGWYDVNKGSGAVRCENASGQLQIKLSVSSRKDSESGKGFEQIYKIGDKLGDGAFSVVKKGAHRQTHKCYAIKIVTRAKLTKEDEIALVDEIRILTKLQHTHIIRLYDTFTEPEHYYLVTELLEGGELFDRIVAKAFYNEKEARDVCKILFEAISYCHSKGVVHRDLKPENLLLMGSNDSDIKIADFGFAKEAKSSAYLRTQCGTPGYVAPEILEGVPYGAKADQWSLGVIVYILLGGYPPFVESNQRELFRKIRKGQFEFHDEYWSNVSNEAKQLISSLLTVSPEKRLSAVDSLTHPWIVGSDADLAGKDLGTNLDRLKTFNAKRKFRAGVNAIILANKLESLGKNFKNDMVNALPH
mmetsp:Transcript_7744/g.11286  ORF Transcript_7744/g.11286 Transcript_7744/m.11286 type:complete len:475 (+) Transcript_7744:86-1510(+)|eukprot:CAMPEP_0195519624 /NCGR_PEP_ID=MMETSP0794_2-20130614/15153_1 /TAXON_ID=515487 /ORGANISM="Stephanopyxis turris, Strain CCMP 815" /LENGTH=474 /DNA_ID=CAMNT_0040648809 /DNA_START=86 /DNA_END=1510 /DNA_ORIENTATION=+